MCSCLWRAFGVMAYACHNRKKQNQSKETAIFVFINGAYLTVHHQTRQLVGYPQLLLLRPQQVDLVVSRPRQRVHGVDPVVHVLPLFGRHDELLDVPVRRRLGNSERIRTVGFALKCECYHNARVRVYSYPFNDRHRKFNGVVVQRLAVVAVPVTGHFLDVFRRKPSKPCLRSDPSTSPAPCE